ncbi:hypothetical protein M0804_013849 [Polistes exclamans]|nr:hypothetical protein M0804_013849 [Polistes exclamans]
MRQRHWRDESIRGACESALTCSNVRERLEVNGGDMMVRICSTKAHVGIPNQDSLPCSSKKGELRYIYIKSG